MSNMCQLCDAGSYTVDSRGFNVCRSPDLVFDFRGCITGKAVKDSGSSIFATPYASDAEPYPSDAEPKCTGAGLVFDGVKNYVELTPWNFGGPMSFEAFVYYDVSNTFANSNSRVFDFRNLENGVSSDSIYLRCEDITGYGSPGTVFSVYGGKENLFGDGENLLRVGGNFWWTSSGIWPWHTNTNTWVHVVAIASDTLTIYKNGDLAGTTASSAPKYVGRNTLWIGRSPGSFDDYFKGTIAYLRIWSSTVLDENAAKSLYNSRNACEKRTLPVEAFLLAVKLITVSLQVHREAMGLMERAPLAPQGGTALLAHPFLA